MTVALLLGASVATVGFIRASRERNRALRAGDWKIVMSHGFYYGSGSVQDGWQWYDNPETIKAVTPLFEKYGVNLVFSGHKICGPTGIGILYAREERLAEMPPYQGGGEMISSVTFEKTTYARIPAKFEAGTPNIAGTIALGAAIGYPLGVYVPMTAMPELVAAFHSLVGMAAVLVAAGAFYAPSAFGIGTEGHIHQQSLIEMSLGVAIGAITFTGSVIAFLKLSGRMSGKPIILPARHLVNIALAVGLVAFIALFYLHQLPYQFWAIVIIALVFVGGANLFGRKYVDYTTYFKFAGGLQPGVRYAYMRIEAASGSRHRIGGDLDSGRQSVF